jgi:hypothetical protein
MQYLCVVSFLNKPILTWIWNYKLEKFLLRVTNYILFIQRTNLRCKEYCIFKIINYINCNVISGLTNFITLRKRRQ